MSAQSSAMSSSNITSKDAGSIGNGVSSTGGPAASGSQQTEWGRRTNGISLSNTPINNSTSNQSGPRRPSLSTTLTHHPREYPSSISLPGNVSGTATPSSVAYQPPHSVGRDASNPYKYSKEYMLGKFEGLELTGAFSDINKVNKLLLGESEKEGLFGGGSKERSGNGTEACWDSSGQQRPVSFEAMTSEEKELFQSVNSIQKPHQTPNTPGGPNSTSIPPGQVNQPRMSTSSTNLNSNFHKSSISVSSTGTTAPPGTASPTTRNRPRRDTGDANPLARRRTDRDDSGNPFDRFSGRSPFNQPGDDARDTEDSGPSRGVFKRQASGGPWGVSSPITPGGSAFGAFSNGAFGGVGGSSFVLNSGVPAAKTEGDRKFGSLGKSAGRSLVGDRVEEESEETDDISKGHAKDTEIQSSLQELARESEAEPEFGRDGYGRRSDSTDTDPYNPRKSLQPGDLDVENPLDDGIRNPHSQLGQDSYFNEAAVGAIGRNMMSSPTRNIGSAFNAFGSSVASPSSSRQGQHTPLSGFHHIQTQMGGPGSGSQELENPSPSSTNPYQSPIPETEEGGGEEGSGLRNFRPPGGSDRSQTSSAGILGTGAGMPGFGGLGGGFNNALGTPGLWSNPGPSGALGTGTPQNTGPAGFFGPSGDSSGVGTPGGTSGAFGATRASRLGALFPAEQQQQLIQEQQRQQSRNIYDEDSAFDPTEPFRGLSMADRPKTENRNSADSMFGGPPRVDNAYFGEAEGQAPGQQIQNKASFPALSHSNSVSSLQQFGSAPTPGAAPGSSTQPGSQRNSGGHIMIMPDKITWVYKDPTGKIQGPFSGLEMHDWYKAGFFQPDLLIRRQEETEFELLGHFIRRVGNSREPFLIPMQGPAFPPGAGWTAPNPWGQNTIDAANGIVQPPFPGAFPTFGTTLTAEQQNALERRKQEEQYLMARQREYLVQQQVIAKQVAAAQHMTRMSQESLQHHPSQASLHSQPSLTNIQSPSTFPPQTGPFSELRHTTSNPSIDGFTNGPREEFAGFPQGYNAPASQPQQTSREQAQILERQRAQMARQYQGQHQVLERQQQQRTQLFQQAIVQPPREQQQHGNQGPVQGQQAGGLGAMSSYQVAAGDDAIDITQDVGFDNDARSDMTGTALADEYELFQKQHQLQIQQHDEDLLNQHYDQGQSFFPGDIDYTAIPPHNIPLNNEINEITAPSITSISAGPGPQLEPGTYTDEANANEASIGDESFITHDDDQMHISDPQEPSPLLSSISPEPPKNPWGIVPPSGMPLPFPAPKSVASPRPSTAQSVAKSPAVSTAELQTIPIAPWAKDPEASPHQKGPSLKEIQENQAKQVAKAEAAAQEARRQEQAQQAALAAASAPAPPTSGLPSTSTWAAPTPSPVATASVWAKPLAKAPTTPLKQKTLTQIQKEEEARKHKAVTNSPSTTTPAPTAAPAATPTRRSEWASKAAAAPSNPVAPTTNTVGGAWTTVGAGGKKLGGATTISSPTPAQARIITSAPTPKIVKKPTTVQLAAATPQKTANDEFMKWCKINLKGLNSGVNVDEFVTMIMSFPPEIDLISDSVYQQSTTIDGRRFAEEFIRRRKLAQQGVVVDHGHHSDENKTGGGWSEVAKKSREPSANNSSSAAAADSGLGNGSFKVVQGKKKRR
ncbi:hypothetical protein TWF225_010752 [Orbilia oligospora]|nr:hypothetical protein TWF225_010752 [Orbilia oligospora]KAF3171028.1 hypothetical protein TWF751_006521 [Orbilia oligospora]KAF3242523.1 hypothetical protein TWF128_010491 [Orbilia oligospora]KAF3242524.1 hypothetical protein TWF128_010491 [Orbilia oligospora]KAF3253636.1 hypothetical protein TWF217_007419 [Orbilia oligospora]